jgi:hypothetical protein
MNEMSTPLTAALEMAIVPTSFGIDDAHILRSKIIGKCATVECWLSEQISTVEKPELMLSQKIEQLKKLSDQGKIIFKCPKKLRDRLEAFQPFADFRSEIVHSEMTLSMVDGTATTIFENAAQICPKLFRKKTLISREGFEGVWQDMSKAANLLTTLKPTQR